LEELGKRNKLVNRSIPFVFIMGGSVIILSLYGKEIIEKITEVHDLFKKTNMNSAVKVIEEKDSSSVFSGEQKKTDVLSPKEESGKKPELEEKPKKRIRNRGRRPGFDNYPIFKKKKFRSPNSFPHPLDITPENMEKWREEHSHKNYINLVQIKYVNQKGRLVPIPPKIEK
jgi:hypothetical protein